MKAASISELQKELALLERKQILELCMRLAKYKKDNKEFLSYLLFEAEDEKAYILSVKEKVEAEFLSLNRNTIYFTKKGLRRILRMLNKFIKYSGSKQTEVELRIFFCSKMKANKIPMEESVMLSNIYKGELKKVKASLLKLHEDIQYDYQQELDKL